MIFGLVANKTSRMLGGKWKLSRPILPSNYARIGLPNQHTKVHMNAFTTVLVVQRVEENFGQIQQAQKEESQKADGKYRPCS
jgi:hypothetical protein